MNRKRRMNEMSTAKITPFPGFEALGEEAKERKSPSWAVRLGSFIGVLMANPESPRGWSFNPAVITCVLTIAGMVAFGGYYMGQKDAENRQLMERIQKAEADAAEAKKLGIYAAAGQDESTGHKPTPKEKK